LAGLQLERQVLQHVRLEQLAVRFLVEALVDLDRLEPWPRRPPAKVDTLDVQPNLVGLDAVPAVRLADRDDAGLDIEAVAAARHE
jgi:hypothetical protein